MISLQLLMQAVDHSNDGIVITEPEGRDNIIIYANAAFEKLTGYTQDEILYQDCRFLQKGEPQVGLIALRNAIAQGQATRQIILNFKKDGTPFWNELSIAPIFNQDDRLTYFIGVQKDVSDIVALREEVRLLRQRIADLESRG